MLGSRKTLTHLAAASVVLATGLTVLGTAAATAATPRQTGCPSNGQPGGWLFLSVSDLIAQGYINVGRNVDHNADGYICGKPVSEAYQNLVCSEVPGGCTVPVIYYFLDNDLTPHH